MQERKLGRQGLIVSALGLGCMPLGVTDIYSSSVRDEAAAIALIHRAIDSGVTLLDTANIYGESELRIGKALKGRRDGVVLATKFGIVPPSSGRSSGVDCRPETMRKAFDISLKCLGVDYIDLYYPHRVDADVPIEDTVGAMAELVQAGKVRYLGLCEAAPATIRRAHQVHPISVLQSEYSLWSREPEDVTLPTLRELGIGFVAYSPLGRGFLAGRFKRIDDLAPSDMRRNWPRFQGDNFARNLALVEQINSLAREKGCTPSQLALAWLLAQGENIVPIPGTSNVARLDENIAAASVQLAASDLERIDAVAPKDAVAGARGAPAMLQLVNR